MSVPDPLSRGRLRIFLFYVSAVGLALAVFLAVSWFGEATLSRSTPPSPAAREMSAQIDTLLHVLIALATVIVTARAVGALFSVVHQPPVIGEVVGGILLGPSLLGWLAPALHDFLLPPRAAPFLGVIAQLGVILYMFVVGLRFDLRVLRHSGPMTLAISHASITVPFVLGVLLALALYEGMAPGGATFTAFALFMACRCRSRPFPCWRES